MIEELRGQIKVANTMLQDTRIQNIALKRRAKRAEAMLSEIEVKVTIAEARASALEKTSKQANEKIETLTH